MTLALGTSSPIVSVALIGGGGAVLAERRREAKGAASGALAVFVDEVLRETDTARSDLSRIVVDVGPGGFTGVKVGVTFAKTLAWALGIAVHSVSSFDLISRDRTVAVPSKKGEWYVRKPGSEPTIETTADLAGMTGYGTGFDTSVWPNVARVATFIEECPRVDPFDLVPSYVASPSISVPKSFRVLPEATS